jgi:asparagine N-glycosylation enzyme membrane subunit Stt3
MGNWGEDSDYEAQAIKEHVGRFTVNFKKIYYDVDEISEKTLEVTDTHPKDSLMKLWAGTMIGLFIFFCIAYQILAIVAVPFVAFYLIALFRIGKCWKSFKYSPAQFWGMSVVTILVLFGLSRVLLQLVLG